MKALGPVDDDGVAKANADLAKTTYRVDSWPATDGKNYLGAQLLGAPEYAPIQKWLSSLAVVDVTPAVDTVTG